MNMLINAAAEVATVFSILGGLLLLAKLWHEPRFVTGILPTKKSDAPDLFTKTSHGTAQRVMYLQKALSQSRVYSRDSLDIVLLPVLLQNQGHGIASSLTVNIEFDTNKVEILDIFTEAMKVNAVFGNADNISSKLKGVVADSLIRDAYARIGPGGTYIQLVGAFPAVAVEIFIVKVKAKEPIDNIGATIRTQTPSRILQQKAIHQKLTIK